MATREDIEQQILRRAEKKGLVVDWKELALRLLEWQSNLYPGDSPFIVDRCLKPAPSESSGS